MNNAENNDQPAPPSTGLGALAQSIGARNLWIIILTMPAVFLVVVAAIIAVFGKPRSAEEATAEPVAQPVAAGEPAPITIAADAAAGAIALDGDRLAVRIDGPDGVVVVIYDIAKGEVIARVPVEAAATTD